MSGELIRGRWHPDLHPVLRVQRGIQWCRALSPPFIDEEDGEEYNHCCCRPEGHTGRHFDWEWAGRGQKVHVWTDDECDVGAET